MSTRRLSADVRWRDPRLVGPRKRNEPSALYRNGYQAAQRLNGKTNIIWLVAGEAGGHSRDGAIPREKIEAVVKGIRDGDDDDKLLTIHADYRRGRV